MSEWERAVLTLVVLFAGYVLVVIGEKLRDEL